jgi:hypothetical protein
MDLDNLMDDKQHLRQKLRDKIRGKQMARRTRKVPKKKNPQGIYEIVESIQHDRTRMSFPDLLAKYKEFSESHLDIFRVASSRNMDGEEMQRLKHMLMQKEMIESGQITLEEASALTSEQLAKRYQPDLLKNNQE